MISCWILTVRNISDKSCTKQNTQVLCLKPLFLKYCHLWGNLEKNGTARQATNEIIILRRKMGFACRIPKATNTLSQYLMLIALPLKQWLHKRTSMLRCTYNVSLVISELSISITVYGIYWLFLLCLTTEGQYYQYKTRNAMTSHDTCGAQDRDKR